MAALDVYANADKIMDEAITLAKYYDAKITGIHVVEIQPTLSNAEINPSEGNKAKKIMLSIKESCEKRGIQFAFEIPYGTASSEIARPIDRARARIQEETCPSGSGRHSTIVA